MTQESCTTMINSSLLFQFSSVRTEVFAHGEVFIEDINDFCTLIDDPEVLGY